MFKLSFQSTLKFSHCSIQSECFIMFYPADGVRAPTTEESFLWFNYEFILLSYRCKKYFMVYNYCNCLISILLTSPLLFAFLFLLSSSSTPLHPLLSTLLFLSSSSPLFCFLFLSPLLPSNSPLLFPFLSPLLSSPLLFPLLFPLLSVND